MWWEEIPCGVFGKPQQKNHKVEPYHNLSKSMQSTVINYKPSKKQLPVCHWALVVFGLWDPQWSCSRTIKSCQVYYVNRLGRSSILLPTVKWKWKSRVDCKISQKRQVSCLIRCPGLPNNPPLSQLTPLATWRGPLGPLDRGGKRPSLFLKWVNSVGSARLYVVLYDLTQSSWLD